MRQRRGRRCRTPTQAPRSMTAGYAAHAACCTPCVARLLHVQTVFAQACGRRFTSYRSFAKGNGRGTQRAQRVAGRRKCRAQARYTRQCVFAHAVLRLLVRFSYASDVLFCFSPFCSKQAHRLPPSFDHVLRRAQCVCPRLMIIDYCCPAHALP